MFTGIGGVKNCINTYGIQITKMLFAPGGGMYTTEEGHELIKNHVPTKEDGDKLKEQVEKVVVTDSHTIFEKDGYKIIVKKSPMDINRISKTIISK